MKGVYILGAPGLSLMTRINVIPVDELIDKHLLAEYRELPRILALTRARQEKGLKPSACAIPSIYVLGKGHMLFFIDKLAYLVNRYDDIVHECDQRGFDVQYRKLRIQGIHREWFGDYTPTKQALALNRARIEHRIKQMTARK